MRRRNPFNPVPHKNREVFPEQAECTGINQMFSSQKHLFCHAQWVAQTTIVMGPSGQHVIGPCHFDSVATTKKTSKILSCITWPLY